MSLASGDTRSAAGDSLTPKDSTEAVRQMLRDCGVDDKAQDELAASLYDADKGAYVIQLGPGDPVQAIATKFLEMAREPGGKARKSAAARKRESDERVRR